MDGSNTVAALRHSGFVDPDRTDFDEERYWCRPKLVAGPLQELIAKLNAKYAIRSEDQPEAHVVGRIVDARPE